MNVVIVGCGRVGGFLAGLLDAEGHRVSVVDIASQSPARAERAWFQHLPSSFKGETILGDLSLRIGAGESVALIGTYQKIEFGIQETKKENRK